MSHLNSVILEGTVQSIDTDANENVKLTVATNEYHKRNGKYVTEQTIVPVIIPGCDSAELSAISQPYAIRIIGKLAVSSESTLCVIAQQIETSRRTSA